MSARFSDEELAEMVYNNESSELAMELLRVRGYEHPDEVY